MKTLRVPALPAQSGLATTHPCRPGELARALPAHWPLERRPLSLFLYEKELIRTLCREGLAEF